MAGTKKRRDHEDKSGSAEARPTSHPPCYDVFISYSSRDKAWVRGELLQRIEHAGLKAFIDFRDFTRGAPSIKEMERGVLTSTKTLLVLTPDYIESEWCDLEAIMAQTLNPANRDLRMIPLLRTECEKPLRIAALTHVDFTEGADLDLAWRQLLTALGAPPVQEPPEAPERDQWFLAHPYPMPPNFTGRTDERKMLSRWLDTDMAHPLLVLRALGGFGKSALAWHWLTHDVGPSVCPRVVWWSFYEGDSSFDHFLAETLGYLSGGRVQADKLSAKDAVKALLAFLYAPGTLLILDGFERELRAFGGLNAAYQGDEAAKSETNECDCISPLADLFLYHVALQPSLRSKVLLTTRLRPHVLEAKGGGLFQGCREEELRQMQSADAVEFFRAQGIRGMHTEIEGACEPYGYHPLSLRLLAGWIVSDLQQPGDIAAAKRLDVSGDLVARQYHVLEQAYDSLMPARRVLLGRIACFRSPVTYDTLKAVAETAEKSSTTLEADLRDLVSRGLLHHDTKKGRFDLHPIVRRYAYDRLTAPDRTATHTRLRDYFAAVPKPDKATRLEDLASVIELYHHTIRTGQFDEACKLLSARIAYVLHFQFGDCQLRIDLLRALFPDGDDQLPRLRNERAQAWALNELAMSFEASGQPRRAVALFEASHSITDRRGQKERGKKREAHGSLGNLGHTQMTIGSLRAAEANLRRYYESARKSKDRFMEAVSHQELGRLSAYRGAYTESETELATALKMFGRKNWVQSVGVIWASRALRELFLLRSLDSSKLQIPSCALESAGSALTVADVNAYIGYPVERDFVAAHWLLGAAHRVAGQFDKAERHLHEAMERCRRINWVVIEGDILIDLARLRAAMGTPDEAQRLAEEALLITERSGYVLQGADAHLELAKLALARGDRSTALEHAQKAKDLAICDGPPDYTYKVAYDEACALLQGQ